MTSSMPGDPQFDPPQVPQPPAPPPPRTSHAYSRPTSGTSFDPKTVNPMDWGILACGFLALIFSFFGYYTASVGPFSVSESAWHGFFGWFAALVALLAAASVAVPIFAPDVKLPFPPRLIAFAGFALALLCIIIAAFVTPGVGGGVSGVSFGRGVGFWLSLIVIVAGGVLSYVRLKATGGKLPWEK